MTLCDPTEDDQGARAPMLRPAAPVVCVPCSTGVISMGPRSTAIMMIVRVSALVLCVQCALMYGPAALAHQYFEVPGGDRGNVASN